MQLNEEHSGRGRYWKRSCCGARVHFKPGQLWTAKTGLEPRPQLRIIACERDGAIVEQLDRPQDGRFGLSYENIDMGFKRETR